MPPYEYKIIAAPTKGLKGKGVRGPEARFAHALEKLMNDMAADGWEFQRAETLPSIERAGITGTTTEWRNVLVFRRPRHDDASAFRPELLAAPETPGEHADTAPEEVQEDTPDTDGAGDETEAGTELSADNLKNDPDPKG